MFQKGITPMSDYNLETKCIHSGYTPSKGEPCALPVYQSTTYKYDTFIIREPKERLIFKLPYYPDRIVHHAIMNILEPIWRSVFITNTYSCIKKRGIHKALYDIQSALKDKQNTVYCLKLDVRKFYPSIDHEILKQIVRKKIKDNKLLALLDGIIDSVEGVPIGNYLSSSPIFICHTLTIGLKRIKLLSITLDMQMIW